MVLRPEFWAETTAEGVVARASEARSSSAQVEFRRVWKSRVFCGPFGLDMVCRVVGVGRGEGREGGGRAASAVDVTRTRRRRHEDEIDAVDWDC